MKSSSPGFNPQYGEDAPTFAQVSELVGDAILEFGTSWCAHCQAARPAVETVLNEHTELLHIKVADGKGKALGRAFGVKLWPTLILLRDGVEVSRLVRPTGAEELRRLLAQSATS